MEQGLRLGAPQKLDPSRFIDELEPAATTPASPDPDASVAAPSPGSTPAPSQLKLGKPQKLDPSRFESPNMWGSDVVRNMGERASQIWGGVASTIGTGLETAGDTMEGILPLGRIVNDPQKGWHWEPHTKESIAEISELGKSAYKIAGDYRNTDYGYNERTTWQDVVDKPLSNAIPFATEKGLGSLPDMLMVMRTLPGYVFARTGEISYDRAKNDNRPEPTGRDLIAAVPAATLSAYLEKIGTSKIMGLSEEALKGFKQLPMAVLKSMLVEGGTEAGQEATEYTGETISTKHGWKPDEAALRALQGAVVGLIFGGEARAVTGTTQITADKLQAEPAPDQTGNPDTPAAPGQDTPGDVAATPPPPPGTGGGGTVNPTAPAPRPTGTPDWQSDEEARRGEQAKRDWRQRKINEQQAPKGVDPAVAAAATAATAGTKPVVNPGLTPTPNIVGDEFEGADEEGQAPSEAMAGLLARHKGDPDVILAAQQASQPRKPAENFPVTSDMVPTSGAAVRQAGNLAPEPGSLEARQAPAVPAVKTPPVPPAPLAPDPNLAAPAGKPAESVVPPLAPEIVPPAKPAPAAPAVALEGTSEPVQVFSNEDIDRMIAEQEAADAAAAPAAPAPTGELKLGPPQKLDESRFVTPVAPETPKGSLAVGAPVGAEAKPTITLKGKPPEIKGPTEVIKRGSKEVVVEKATPKTGKASVVGKQIADEVTRKRKARPPKKDESTTDAISLADRELLRQRQKQEADEDERVYQEILAQVSEEIAAERQKGAPPAEYVKQNVKRAEDETAKRVEARKYDDARAEEERITAKEEADAKAAKEAEAKRETEEAEEFARRQESGRSTKYKSKTGNAIRKEGVATTLSAWSKNKEDPDLAEWHKAYLARQQVTGGQKGRLTGEKKTLFDGLTMLMKQHNESRAQKVDAADEAKAEAGRAEQEKARTEQGAAPKPAPDTEAKRVKEQAEAAKFAERVAKIRKPLQEAISKLPALAIPKGTSVRQSAKVAREWATQVADDLRRAITRTGGAKTDATKLPQKVDVANTPEENLAVYAQAVKKGKGGLSYIDLMEAVRLYGEGKYADMVNFMGDAEAALVEEGDIKDQPGERVTVPMMDDESGVARPAAAAAQEPATKAGGTIYYDVPNSQGGGNVEVTVLARKTGTQALRDAALGLSKMDFPFRLMEIMQRRQLMRLVGDTEVRFVSTEDMVAMNGGQDNVLGFYDRWFDWNEKPIIYIDKNKYDAQSPAERNHTVMHEMTHAATTMALRQDLYGMGKIVRVMVNQLRAQVAKDGLDWRNIYGLANEQEFIAEGFANPKFQQLLMKYAVPMTTRIQLALARRQAVATEGVPQLSWWDNFVSAVAHGIGMVVKGKPANSYLAQTISLHPFLMRSTEQQQIDLGRPWNRRFEQVDPTMAPPGQGMLSQAMSGKGQVAPSPQLIQQAAAGADAALQKAGVNIDWAGWGDRFSRVNKVLSTTQNNRRRWVRAGGQEGDAFTQLSDKFLKMAQQTRELAEDGEKIVKKLMQLRSNDTADANRLATTALDATRFTADVSVPLSHKNNGHISKKGFRDRHKRAAHARGAAEYAKLSPDAKALYDEMAAYYRSTEDQRVVETVKQIVSNAVSRFGVVLPPGVTETDAVNWVVNGDIDRPAPVDPQNRQPGERTVADDAMHKALGKTVKSLEGSTGLRKVLGLYVPLSRFGNRFFSAHETIPLPAGAVRETGTINEFLFDKQSDLDKFQDSSDWTMDVKSEWWDPNTGQKSSKKNPGTVQVFRAKVQNQVMEMSDSKSDLNRKRKDLLANPNFDPKNVTEVLWAEKELNSDSEILPRQIRRLLNSVAQGAKGSKTAAQDAVEKQIIQAYIRQLGGARASHHRLKRKSVRGYSEDLAQATLSYAHTWASHITNLRNADEIADLEDQLRKDYQRQAGKMAGYKQNMVNELVSRIKANNGSNDVYYGKELQRGLLDVSFMNHLATLAYSVAGLTQNFAVTHPRLAAQFGWWATAGALTRAMWNMGAAGTLMRGAGELAAETRHIIPVRKFGSEFKRTGYDYMTYIKKKLAHVPGFDKVLDEIHEMGFGFASGLETEAVSELERSKAGKLLSRGVAAARALPHAVEVVNRVGTALATYELAQRSGMTQDQARQLAVDVTEQTQGGYSAENNPSVMTHGLGGYARVPFQFKKYPMMYGQLYYDALAQTISPTRKGDRAYYGKLFMYMTLHGIPLAGLFGMPLVEFGRALVMVGGWLGAQDDWEDWESWMQDMANDYVNKDVTEAMLHGWSRLADIDLSGRLSNSNMILFGEPDDYKEADVKSWFMDLLLGAGGTMAFDAAASVHNHDWGKVLPMPAFIKDMMKAYEHYNEGYVSKRTGKQYAKPTSTGEAIAQGLGFRPADEARQYEAGGGGARHKAETRVGEERTKLMQRWVDNPSSRSSIYSSSIARFNRAHPNDKITRGGLQRSLNKRRQDKRERMREGAQ